MINSQPNVYILSKDDDTISLFSNLVSESSLNVDGHFESLEEYNLPKVSNENHITILDTNLIGVERLSWDGSKILNGSNNVLILVGKKASYEQLLPDSNSSSVLIIEKPFNSTLIRQVIRHAKLLLKINIERNVLLQRNRELVEGYDNPVIVFLKQEKSIAYKNQSATVLFRTQDEELFLKTMIGALNINYEGESKYESAVIKMGKGDFVLKIIQQDEDVTAIEISKLNTPLGSQEPSLNTNNVYNNISEAMILTNGNLNDLKILHVNKAFEEMTGYSLSEIKGKSPKILQGPKSDRRVLNQLRANLSEGKEFRGSSFNYRKDGYLYLVGWYISPIKNVKGEITHFVSLQKDLSKENEILGIESDQHAESKHAVHRAVVQYRWVPSLGLFDYTEELAEIIESDVHKYNSPYELMEKFHHPDDRKEIRAWFSKIKRAKHNEVTTMTYRIIDAKNQVKWVRNTVTVDGNDPECIALNGTVTDISEEKILIKKRTNQANYGSALDTNFQLGVVLYNKEGNILWTNSVVQNLFESRVEDDSLSSEWEIKSYGGSMNSNGVVEYFDSIKSTLKLRNSIIMVNPPLGNPFYLLVNSIESPSEEDETFYTTYTDVTSFLKSQQRLVEHEQQVRDIANSISGTIAVFRRSQYGEESVRFLSENNEAFFAEEIKSIENGEESFWEAVHPNDQERIKALFDESEKFLTPLNAEYRVRAHDGSIKWVNNISLPKKTQDNYTEWTSIIFDITEKKKSETKNTELYQKLTTVTQLSDFGTWEMDIKTQKLTWDSTMYGIFGIDKKKNRIESVDHALARVHKEDKKKLEHHTETLLKKGFVKDVEFRITDDDGYIRFIRSNFILKRSESGEPISILGANIDITGSKRSEQLASQLQHIVDTSLNEIFIYDAHSHQFYYANKSACNNSGHALEELLELNVFDLIEGKDARKVRTEIGRLLSGKKQVSRLRITIKRKNGSHFVADISSEIRAWGNKSVCVSIVNDLTEHLAKDHVVLELNEKLKLATEAAQVGFWEYKYDEGVVEWDATTYEIYGVEDTSEQIHFSKFMDFVHPDDRPFFVSMENELVGGKKDFQYEHRIVRADGAVRYLKVHAVVTDNAEMVGVCIDVTDMKEAEQIVLNENSKLQMAIAASTQQLVSVNEILVEEIDARQHAEDRRIEAQRDLIAAYRRLNSIANNITEAVYRVSDSKIVYANPGMAKMFGYEDTALLEGQNISDLCLNREQAKIFNTNVENQDSWTNVHIQFTKSDGDVFTGAVSGSKYVDKEKEECFIDGTIQDITTQIEIQNELKRSRNDLETAQRMSRLGNWRIGLDNGKLDWMKNEFTSVGLLDIHSQPYHSNFMDEVFEEDINNLNEACFRALKSDRAEFQFRLRLKTNAVRYVKGIVRKEIDKNGLPISLFGVSLDISKETEIALQLQESMEESERLANIKQQFLANMSHEIRTPINGIRGLTYLIAKTELNSKQEKYIKSIQHSSDILLGIVNEILDLSKIESGNETLENHTMDILETVETAWSLLKTKAQEKSIKYVLKEIVVNEPIVIGDSRKIFQSITNILDNAIKFTSVGSVAVSLHQLSKKNQFNTYQIRIEDSGNGIRKDEIRHVFEPFNQSSTTTARNYGGTGLGLSIVKRYVEMMGGEVKVQSEIGIGTIFTIELPLAVGQVSDLGRGQIDEQLSTDIFNGKEVLLVDDNAINRMWVRNLLEDWGMIVDEAEDGEIALEMSFTKKYELILMDIYMPKLNGYEASFLIREDVANKSNNATIIALTADVLENQKPKIERAKMNGVLGKPFEPKQLSDLIFGHFSTESSIKNRVQSNQNDGNQLINLSELRSLSKGNEAFVKRVIIELEKYLEDIIPHLKMEIEDSNTDQIREIIHKLKPNLAYLGAADLFERAKAILDLYEEDKIENASKISSQSQIIHASLGLIQQELKKLIIKL